ncbi:MAG: glycosyltransferase, partial [Candidatus Verstraetearchaeota archaeon]|nr:glycosyltransferase [Candidatus Verstraetearchaeota archaeon]
MTSVDHPQVRLEAEHLGKKLDLTYVVVPNLNKNLLPRILKYLVKHFPKVCLSLIKLRPPLIPQVLYYLLLFVTFLENKKIASKKYDIIYAHWLYPAGFLALLLSKIWKTKVISVIWGYDIQVVREAKDYGIHGINRVISRFVIEKSSLVITNHKIHKIIAQCISKQKVNNKIIYIPPAIPDISLNIREEPTTELKEKILPILNNSGKKVVLYAPSLRPIYGIKEFLKAARIVSNSIKDCAFIIVGDGELKNEAIKFIRENELEDRVFLLGKVSYESMKILYKMSTLVCDLAYPGSGTTTLEAFCFGKPVIGIKSPKSIITHGKNGFLIEKGDYGSLAKYMEILLKNPKLQETFSLEARNTYEKYFNIEKRILVLVGIFNKMMRGS